MGDTLLASDAAACPSRSFEIQRLARRLESCVHRTDGVVARLGELQLEDWRSPAGRAYRTSVAVQRSALRTGREALQEASGIVLRHAQAAATTSRREGS